MSRRPTRLPKRFDVNRILPALLATFVVSAANASAEDKGAVVLLDSISFRIIDGSKGRLFHRRIVRVENETGRSHADFNVIDNPFVKTEKVTGVVRDPEGKVVRKLNKKDIETGPLYPGYVLYSDTTYQRFNLGHNAYPFEVEYTAEKTYRSLFFWPDWKPQEEIPVVKATYVLSNESGIEFRFHTEGDVPDPVTHRHVKTWSLENLPVIGETESPEVSFAPTRFTLGGYSGHMDTWDGLAAWYDRMARARYAPSPGLRQTVSKLKADSKSPKETISRLYSFLQDHTRYVAVHIGVGGWQPHEAEETFRVKYGDCKA